MEANRSKELVVIHANRPGIGAAVFGVVSDAGADIRAVCGYSLGNKAVLTVVTDQNAKAKRALKKAGYSVDEREVVTVQVANRQGMFAEMTKRLADGGVDLEYAYASVGAKTKALVVLQTSDDVKALRLLKKK